MQNPLAMPMAWDLVADGYVSDVVPMFTGFAETALLMAALPPGAQVLDVCCGPGTLALVAAKAAARVDALDFSPVMIERLERVAPPNVFPRLGDAQALPYPDQSFDAAFSMFGVIFFPDRAKGLAELHRVVRKGGRVVISSWPPSDRVPLMQVLFAAMREQGLGLPEGPPALGEAADYERELGVAGFKEIRPEVVTRVMTAPSLDALWDSLARSMAPLVLMRKAMGEERFAGLEKAIRQQLAARFGSGEQRIEMPAWLTVATA
jgi:ubiquinone/menaquinone biosynthesis C-methylase UbiE